MDLSENLWRNHYGPPLTSQQLKHPEEPPLPTTPLLLTSWQLEYLEQRLRISRQLEYLEQRLSVAPTAPRAGARERKGRGQQE